MSDPAVRRAAPPLSAVTRTVQGQLSHGNCPGDSSVTGTVQATAQSRDCPGGSSVSLSARPPAAPWREVPRAHALGREVSRVPVASAFLSPCANRLVFRLRARRLPFSRFPALRHRLCHPAVPIIAGRASRGRFSEPSIADRGDRGSTSAAPAPRAPACQAGLLGVALFTGAFMGRWRRSAVAFRPLYLAVHRYVSAAVQRKQVGRRSALRTAIIPYCAAPSCAVSGTGLNRCRLAGGRCSAAVMAAKCWWL